ncbi:MAG: hypothetical protein KAU91_04215, partial [Candidatus Aminicenantes bacterium]|nr:hypothetical protein [Candidatus Aminicenantes bacterium]
NKDKLVPVEVKFQKSINVPVSIKNFNKNYADKVDYNIIITLDRLDFQNNIYSIPVVLFPFVEFDKEMTQT